MIERKTDYGLILDQARELSLGVPSATAGLANLSALIYGSLGGINWAGFYLADGDRLVLGPFQGKPACVVIQAGRGVCGTAAAENRTVLVPDVHLFKGHIACDGASRSEIVVPLRVNGKVAGVLDVDSPELSRFTERDREGLEALAACAEDIIAAFSRQI